jgi:hypothetical protein
MRLLLVSGLNGYICIVKVFKQVDLKFDSHLMKYSSCEEICPIIENLS